MVTVGIEVQLCVLAGFASWRWGASYCKDMQLFVGDRVWMATVHSWMPGQTVFALYECNKAHNGRCGNLPQMDKQHSNSFCL